MFILFVAGTAMLIVTTTALAHIFFAGLGSLQRYVIGTLLWSVPTAIFLIVAGQTWAVLLGMLFLGATAITTALMRAIGANAYRKQAALRAYNDEKTT